MAIGIIFPIQFVDVAHDMHRLHLEDPELGPMLAERGKDKGTGGFVCIAAQDGFPLVLVQLGIITDLDSRRNRWLFAQEKARRLASHPEHVLSRQSENEAFQMFAGAVRGETYIYAYSGDPGHEDELKMLDLAREVGDLSTDRVREILSEHPNKYATPGVLHRLFGIE